MDEEIYKRNCPNLECQKELIYSTKYTLAKANADGTVCKTCSTIKQWDVCGRFSEEELVDKKKKYDMVYWKQPSNIIRKKLRTKEYEQRLQIRVRRKELSQTPKEKYRQYRRSARDRKLQFDLSFEEFMTFWEKSCIYSGDKIKTIGIDRVDSSKGYNFKNCVPCCEKCNRIKLNYNLEELNFHMLKMLLWQGVI